MIPDIREFLTGERDAVEPERMLATVLFTDVVGSTDLLARIGGMAGPGEVLVSGSVRDIAAGSGLAFTDRGEHTLRRVPATWRVYTLDR